MVSPFQQQDPGRYLEVTKDKEKFAAGLKQNIEEVRTTINKGLAVDHEFFRILLDDANALQQLSPGVEEIARKVEGMRKEILELKELAETSPKPVAGKQYVGAPCNPSFLMAPEPEEPKPSRELESEDIRKAVAESMKEQDSVLAESLARREGLAEIGKAYVARKIAGDGHCAFRAYSTGLLGGDYPRADLRTHLNGLEKAYDDRIDFNLLKGSLDRLDAHEPLEAVLNDAKISDEWVKLCREVVSERVKLPEGMDARVDSIVKDQSGRIKGVKSVSSPEEKKALIEQYSKDIGSMENRLWGGSLDFEILNEVFETKTVDLDPRTIGTIDEDTKKRIEEVPSPQEGQKIVYLIKAQDNHFDVALPRKVGDVD